MSIYFCQSSNDEHEPAGCGQCKCITAENLQHALDQILSPTDRAAFSSEKSQAVLLSLIQTAIRDELSGFFHGDGGGCCSNGASDDEAKTDSCERIEPTEEALELREERTASKRSRLPAFIEPRDMSKASSAYRSNESDLDPSSAGEGNSVPRRESHFRRKALRRQSKSTVSSSTISESVLQAAMSADRVPQSALIKMVEGPVFTYTIAFAIILNSLSIGAQTDWMAREKLTRPPDICRRVEISFCLLFSMELCCRLAAWKQNFFVNDHWKWNVFDMTVVLMQVLEEIAALLAYDFDGLSVMGVLRVFRLIRVLRLVRVFRVVGELRSLVISIVGSLKSLVWVSIFLLGLLYLVGVVLTELTLETIIQAEIDPSRATESLDELQRYFGSIGTSLLSLFQCITGGVNWIMVSTPLMENTSPWIALLMVAYIAFCVFALMNIVTGAFVDSALRTAKQDQDLHLVHFIQQLFTKVDTTKSGSISWRDFQESFHLDEVRKFMEIMEMNDNDVKDMFTFLEKDATDRVEFTVFVDGCCRLMRNARMINVVATNTQFQELRDNWGKHVTKLERAIELLEALSIRSKWRPQYTSSGAGGKKPSKTTALNGDTTFASGNGDTSRARVTSKCVLGDGAMSFASGGGDTSRARVTI